MTNMNTAQINRINLIVERARIINDYLDDDQVEDACRQLEASIDNNPNIKDTMNLIDYLNGCLAYRGNKSKIIDGYQKEITDYDSLFKAIQGNNENAVKYFEYQAHNGTPIKLIG